MNNSKPIIIFYFVYFTWLFTVTYLIADQQLLDYFTITILLLYMAFMRERFDALLFGLVSMIPLFINREAVQFTPLWIPMAWGTTAIALRKFFVLVTK